MAQLHNVSKSATICAVGAVGLSTRIAALRTQAIDVLAVPLGGDRLAAEYLLLQLMSRYLQHTRRLHTPSSLCVLSP